LSGLRIKKKKIAEPKKGEEKELNSGTAYRLSAGITFACQKNKKRGSLQTSKTTRRENKKRK